MTIKYGYKGSSKIGESEILCRFICISESKDAFLHRHS